MKKKKIGKKIGIFGGSFDPPHRGHVQIAKLSLKKLNLNQLFWAITKRNPLKKKPLLTLNDRILLSNAYTEFLVTLSILSYSVIHENVSRK